MFRIYLLIVSLLLSASAFAGTSLEPMQYEYAVSKNDMHLGRNHHQLTRLEDGSYQMQAETRAEGIVALFFSEVVKETSHFRLKDDQIQPLHYRYYKNSKKPETFEVDYDRQQQVLRHSLLEETLPLQDNDQDLLSFQLAMMLSLQQSTSRVLKYRIADKNRIENYTLIPRGEKVFDTPQGKLHTIAMEYHDKQRKRLYTFWCARELDYLPYQSRRIEDDGDVILLKLRSYNGRKFSQ